MGGRRITVVAPEDTAELSKFILELQNYFGIDKIRMRMTSGKFYKVFVDGSLFAAADSVPRLRARFWSNWRIMKKRGML